MTKVSEIVRSTLTPHRAAIFRSCSQARWARPRGVRVIRSEKPAIRPRVMQDDEDLHVADLDREAAAAAPNTKPPRITGAQRLDARTLA